MGEGDDVAIIEHEALAFRQGLFDDAAVARKEERPDAIGLQEKEPARGQEALHAGVVQLEAELRGAGEKGAGGQEQAAFRGHLHGPDLTHLRGREHEVLGVAFRLVDDAEKALPAEDAAHPAKDPALFALLQPELHLDVKARSHRLHGAGLREDGFALAHVEAQGGEGGGVEDLMLHGSSPSAHEAPRCAKEKLRTLPERQRVAFQISESA